MGLFCLSMLHNSARAENGVWIDVDTTEHTLLVMQGDAIQAVFKNVAIGRFGTTWSKMTKDDKTPLGKFRVGWVNEKSRYYRFFGLDYPNLKPLNGRWMKTELQRKPGYPFWTQKFWGKHRLRIRRWEGI